MPPWTQPQWEIHEPVVQAATRTTRQAHQAGASDLAVVNRSTLAVGVERRELAHVRIIG